MKTLRTIELIIKTLESAREYRLQGKKRACKDQLIFIKQLRLS